MGNVELHNLYSSPKYHQNDQTEEKDVGGEYSKYGRDEKFI